MQQLVHTNSRRCFNAGEYVGFRRIVAFAGMDSLYIESAVSDTAPQSSVRGRMHDLDPQHCVDRRGDLRRPTWPARSSRSSALPPMNQLFRCAPLAPATPRRTTRECWPGSPASTAHLRLRGSGGLFLAVPRARSHTVSRRPKSKKTPLAAGSLSPACVEELFLLLSGTTRYPTSSTDSIRVHVLLESPSLLASFPRATSPLLLVI